MFTRRALISSHRSIRSLSRSFGSTSIIRNEELDLSQLNEEALAPVIQTPSIERLDDLKESGISGVISSSVLQDVWFNQIGFNLDDLKYFISESPSKTDLESCFIVQNKNPSMLQNPFQKYAKQQPVNTMMNAFNLTTSNKIIDQYYKLLQKTSKQPSEQLVFQSASSIYNLFYFLSSLKPTNSKIQKPDYTSLLTTPDIHEEIRNKPTGEFIKLIDEHFGSLEELKALLLASARSIKGNGYTWLLHRFPEPRTGELSRDSSKTSSLVILNTYNHGTPHNFRSGQVSSARKYNEKKAKLEDTGLFDKEFTTSKVDIPTIDEAKDAYHVYHYAYEPLFAVGVNPSFYSRDYGVFGKDQYLENVWNSIDWTIVENRLSLNAEDKNTI